MKLKNCFGIFIVLSLLFCLIGGSPMCDEVKGERTKEKYNYDLSNPVLKAIKERRSIRKFQDKDVDSAKIDQILKAATWAPSANNDQPWKFVVVRSKETKEKIVEALKLRMKDYYESQGISLDQMVAYWSNIFAAPVHIFVFCDTSGIELEKEWEETQMLWSIQGVSAACQNILLAAHALGLGSVWTGVTLTVEDEIKAILQVPKKVRLMTTIAIGYPASEPLPPVRKPLSDVAFFETWKGK
jgi:F420 biosynthesis protein FbiB-like protein